MTDFYGKVVVITGAADGIGRAMASAFGAAGARLVLADVDGPKLEAAGRELAALGTQVLTARTDVSERDQVLALREAALARFGTVHVLCNNAGVMGPVDPLWELPVGEWQRVMAVNLWGILHGIQAFLPVMLTAEHDGHILNTASMQGVTAGTLIPEYTVSKHAVVALSEALQAQLAARGARVGVTVLCPGAVSTDLSAREHRRLSAQAQDQPWAVAPGSALGSAAGSASGSAAGSASGSAAGSASGSAAGSASGSAAGSAAGSAVVSAQGSAAGSGGWGGALTPTAVAAAALAAVRDDRFYVFTHSGSRARVEARLRPILDALDASESGPLE